MGTWRSDPLDQVRSNQSCDPLPMSLSIAHLGPVGTYAEQAALAYAQWYATTTGQPLPQLCPCPSIAQTLRSTATGITQLTVAPVENSQAGSVGITLDTLWQLENLRIHQALILPIVHGLVTHTTDLENIRTVYSHSQALGQCQNWLDTHLSQATLIPTNSTTEALKYVETDGSVAAIASERAAQLHRLPVLVQAIQDHPDNCTRFWVLSDYTFEGLAAVPSRGKTYTSLAFSLPENVPGALLKPLQMMADCQINLSRIESRPSKRSLGDYVFFVDIEADLSRDRLQTTLAALLSHTDVLKVFGTYQLLQIP